MPFQIGRKLLFRKVSIFRFVSFFKLTVAISYFIVQVDTSIKERFYEKNCKRCFYPA